MPRFRKKPVEIEAVLWMGREEDLPAVFALVPRREDGSFDLPRDVHVDAGLGFVPALGTLDIPTLEGVMTARPGDWIIRGVAGELYPCKPEIFATTYEPVDPSALVNEGES